MACGFDTMAVAECTGDARYDNMGSHAESDNEEFGVATPVSYGAVTNFEEDQLEEYLGLLPLLPFLHVIR